MSVASSLAAHARSRPKEIVENGMRLDEILFRLRNVRPCAGGATAQCPAHDDEQNSLKVDQTADRTLLHCHAGCPVERICEAAGIKLADLFLNSNGHSHNGAGMAGQRLTLTEFAAAKGFPPEFLEEHGVTEKNGVLHFLYLLMNGQRASRQRIRAALSGARKFLWSKDEGRPTLYGLWRLAQALKRGASDLFLVEGETDALTLWFHSLEALGVPGADMCGLLHTPHVSGFRRVFIVREADNGGDTFEKGCIGRFAEFGFDGEVRVVEMAKAGVKDPNELHLKMLGDPGGFDCEWEALVEMSRLVDLPIVGLEVFDAAMVQPKAVEWIWRNRIPLGKLTLFVGGPGLGKSFVALYICALLTKGEQWPDGALNDYRAVKSIIFSAEDGIADTIVVRLTDLGAERGHIRICRRIREANGAGEVVRRGFNLTRDLPHLEKLLDKHSDAKLIVVDPVSAYLGRTDSHKNAEVRSDILDPLAELAERRGVAIIAVSHFNKGAGKGLDRVSGSIAFPAAARQVWGFVEDPEDPDRRLMLFGKSNVAPKMSGLAFRIIGADGHPVIQWEQGDVDRKLDDVLGHEQEEQRSEKLEAACILLRQLLKDGERTCKEVDGEATRCGIKPTTLHRAKVLLGVSARRKGFGPGSTVWLSLSLSKDEKSM